jgi:hypothetical protein
MGRFDALTELEEKPQKTTPSQVTLSPTPKKTPEPSIKTDAKHNKPEFMKSGKPETSIVSDSLGLKPEKYSTLLDPSLVKKIKIYSAEREIKDYQVIAKALIEYFENHK